MSDDRDIQFEKALARQLRADAGQIASPCLDPEALAAYHKRLLSAEEMSAAKEHLVSCTRCQEILAQLEMTQDLVESQDRRNEVVAATRAQPPLVTAGAPAVVSPKVVQIPAKKNRTLRWAAPAGAIAAVLLLWVGLQEFRTQKTAPYAPTQIAENRKESAPVPAPSAEPMRQGDVQFEARLKSAPAQQTLRETKPSASPSLQVSPKDELSDKPSKQESLPNSRADSLRERTGRGAGAAMGLAQPLAKSKESRSKPDADGVATGGVVAGAAGAIAAPALEAKTMQDRRDSLDAAEKKSAVNGRDFKSLSAVAPPPPVPAAPKLSPSHNAGSGQLHGMVTDSSGAAVAGAHVALKSATGDTVAQTSTDKSGVYSVNGVAAGNYQLELQSAGFKTDNITGLNVAPGENEMNAKLQVGAVTQTVEVAAQAPVTTTSAAGGANSNVVQSEVSEVAVLGRSISTLALPASIPSFAKASHGKSIWRFGDSGQIAHSSDGGKTWDFQSSGVSVNLKRGSAPSVDVCWIAGAAGTLLRTTDGGRTWRTVTTPITTDLGGVLAKDADHADIWDSANISRYQTSDGGDHWKALPTD